MWRVLARYVSSDSRTWVFFNISRVNALEVNWQDLGEMRLISLFHSSIWVIIPFSVGNCSSSAAYDYIIQLEETRSFPNAEK